MLDGSADVFFAGLAWGSVVITVLATCRSSDPEISELIEVERLRAEKAQEVETLEKAVPALEADYERTYSQVRGQGLARISRAASLMEFYREIVENASGQSDLDTALINTQLPPELQSPVAPTLQLREAPRAKEESGQEP